MSCGRQNAGTRPGHEVVQLYVRPIARVKVPMATQPACGASNGLLLQPGERRTVAFRLLTSEAMAFYDEAIKAFTVAPGQDEIGTGAASGDIRARTRLIVGFRCFLAGRFPHAGEHGGNATCSRAQIAITAARVRRQARTAARERAETRVLPGCGRSRRSEMAAPVA